MSRVQQTAREWLLENGYRETYEMIDEIMEEWKRFDKKTRRNWWDVLAGDKEGNPRRVEGRVFPIYNEARKRQGLIPVSYAVDQRKKALQEKELPNWSVPGAQDAAVSAEPDYSAPEHISLWDKLKAIFQKQ